MPSESKSEVTRIWILRHGRSTLNNAQTFQGCGAESELSEEGISSAQAAGLRLRGERIDAIYTSPLRRAVQTAEFVRAELCRNNQAPKLEMDDALRELELPGWEGRSYTAVREQFAEEYRLFRESPENFSLRHPDGAGVWPVLELEKRVHAFLSVLVRNETGKRILLVTHGGPASVLLLAALRLQARYFHTVQIMHGGLSCLSVQRWPDRVKVDVLNEVSHLNAGLPKLKDGKIGLRLLMVASDAIQSNAAHEERLAQMLGRLPIHRTVAADQDGITTAKRLLKNTRQSTIETCTAAGLSEAVNRQLSEQRPDKLFNLLIAGRGELLTAVLKRSMRWDALGTPTSLESCLGLSVVHLPRSTEQPVLQAMNTYRMCATATGETA